MHLRKYLAVDQSPTQQPQKAIIDDDIQHLDQRYSEGKEEFHSEISSLQNQSDKLATQLSKEQIFRDAISTSLGQQSHLVKTQFGHLIDKLKTGQNEVENRLTNMINERIESTHSVIERESNEYKTTLLNYKQFLERDFPEIHRSIGSESTQRSEMDDRLLEELYSDIQYLNEQMEAERTERDNKEEEVIKKIEAMNLEISNMIKTEQAEREKSQEALLRLLESACTKLNKSIDL